MGEKIKNFLKESLSSVSFFSLVLYNPLTLMKGGGFMGKITLNFLRTIVHLTGFFQKE